MTSFLTLAFSWFCALGLLFNCDSALAQTAMPDKKQVQDWVKKIQDSQGLQSPDDPPYHLVAKIRYTFADQAVDGTYEILWAGHDRYRVEFRAGQMGETDVVLGEKRYVQRNTPTMTLAMWSISKLMFPTPHFDLEKYSHPGSVRKLRFDGDGSARQVCATTGDHLLEVRELCFDAATGELAAIHVRPKSDGPAGTPEITMDLTDYANLGPRHFPRHLARRWGPESIDVTIEKWEVVQNFGDTVFAPSTNSSVWDWCWEPTVKPPKPSGPAVPQITMDLLKGTSYFGFYKVVEADGTVKQATLLFSSPESDAKQVIDTELRQRSAVRLCRGKPIAYESIAIFWPGVFFVP